MHLLLCLVCAFGASVGKQGSGRHLCTSESCARAGKPRFLIRKSPRRFHSARSFLTALLAKPQELASGPWLM